LRLRALQNPTVWPSRAILNLHLQEQANSLIVGGPAYFTPEGYQAPYQPEQSFMPTNVAPDPIRDQFNRMYPTPPPPPPAPAPAPAPTPVYEPVVEPVAGPDPVTEPVVEPVVPPGAYPPYIPGVTPFPGIPGLGDLDFSGLPGMGDIDMDRIIQEYQDRQNAGEPEPFDSFLPTPPPPTGPAPQEDDPNFLAFQQTPELSRLGLIVAEWEQWICILPVMAENLALELWEECMTNI
jgi:hypothetical protein